MGNKDLSIFKGFTLAEVLITLGLIGIVAAMTIPILISQYQDQTYKTLYKQAYADFSQAFMQAISEGSMTPRTAVADATATASEWSVLKGAFKIAKDCSTGPLTIADCWAPGDQTCTGACGGDSPRSGSLSFIDSAGRSWATFGGTPQVENIYLVDTNGFKSPNRFGKDRWLFTFMDTNNNRISTGLPAKTGIPLNDISTSAGGWCNYPTCYFKSWLFDN